MGFGNGITGNRLTPLARFSRWFRASLGEPSPAKPRSPNLADRKGRISRPAPPPLASARFALFVCACCAFAQAIVVLACFCPGAGSDRCELRATGVVFLLPPRVPEPRPPAPSRVFCFGAGLLYCKRCDRREDLEKRRQISARASAVVMRGCLVRTGGRPARRLQQPIPKRKRRAVQVAGRLSIACPGQFFCCVPDFPHFAIGASRIGPALRPRLPKWRDFCL